MQIACGGSFSMALTDTGEVFVWGWGEQGQLGLGTTSMARYPEEITALHDKGVTFVTACGSHAIALTRNGEMYAWGSATNGQLGIKTSQSSFTTPTLVEAFAGKQIRNVACAGGIRAGHSIISLEVGDGPSGYQASTFVPAAKPAAEEEEEEAARSPQEVKERKKKKKEEKEKKKKASRTPGLAAGTMMKKMKEVVESTESQIISIQKDKDKIEIELDKLTKEKLAMGQQMARACGAAALSEDAAHAEACQVEVAKCETKLKKVSDSFFKNQKKRDGCEEKEHAKRKEFFDMMSTMKTQQESQKKKREATVQASIDKNHKEQKQAGKEIEKARESLAPLDQGLQERKDAVEEKNADKYRELHEQQEFMSQLEQQITGLGSELQELKDLVEAKQVEYDARCSTMHESIEKSLQIEDALQEEASEEIKLMKDAQTVRDQAKGFLDEAYARDDKLRAEASSMHKATTEFEERSVWVAGLIADTEQHLAKLATRAEVREGLLPQCKSSMLSGGEQSETEPGPSREEELSARLQTAEGELQRLTAEHAQAQQSFEEIEYRANHGSDQLAALHAQKAAAVSARNFKEATALSQQIRSLTDSSDTDTGSLEQAMMALGEIEEKMGAKKQELEAVQLELMSLEQSAGGEDEPEGCKKLRELLVQANRSGQAYMAAFLDAELAVVLACTQAAQGYPEQEWETALRTSHYKAAAVEEESSDEEENEAPPDLLNMWE